MSMYLYGVIRRPGTRAKLSPKVLGTGVGQDEVPVELVTHDDLAAVISRVRSNEIGESAGARALRRDMKAHSDVLARVLEHVTVLPARFGVVFPSRDALLSQFLEPCQQELADYLDRLRGLVELSIRAELDEQAAIDEVARQSPKLLERAERTQRKSAGAQYHERIELGRQIAVGVQSLRDQHAQWLTDRLSAAAREIRADDPKSDLVVFRGSVLIARNKLSRFDNLLQEIAREAGSRMKLACLGPLPPYSFVDLHIPAGRA